MTTDIILINQISISEVKLAVSRIDHEYLTSLTILNFNWERENSKYY